MASISTTRRVLAAVVVTTALCADQAAMAAPTVRSQGTEIANLASRLVNRLAQNFRQVVPSAFGKPARQQCLAEPGKPLIATAVPLSIAHAPLSPFQFRLPPPLV